MTTSIPRRVRHPATERVSSPVAGSTDRSQRGGPGAAAIVGVKRIFTAESGNYFLLLGTTLFLVGFGLVMVLSSSAISSYNDTDDFFTGFTRQLLFAVIGIPLMLVASRLPSAVWKRWAGTLLVIACGLQFLVVATPLGAESGGNRNWLALGPISMQPSELIKVALAIWLAYILSMKSDRLDNIRELAIPIAPVVTVAIGLVLVGGDLGTSLILIAIVMGALFFAGVRLWILTIPLIVAAIVGPAIAFSNESRSARTQAFLDGCSSNNDLLGTCWQTVHGWWALAAGGVFGAGLGNSKSKWSWLPEADNDFIFAIIGEELGLVGAITVLVLFIVMAVAFVRIIRAAADPFARIAVSAVMVWIVGQAFVNIAVVLGLVPVLGVPLPFISSGGSALVTSMFAIGIALSFARAKPQA